MTGRLDAYRAKRDFTRTSEPDGEAPMVRQAEHLRFVVQKHDATRLHYDLRLEVDGVFRSWAVTRGPSLDPAEKRLAVEVEDHPLEYGDFEGTIPEDVYGGGTVMVWDRGFWAPEDGADPAAALEDGHLKLMLVGSKLKGSWALVRMKPRKGETRHNWLLIKHRDQWATPEKDVLRHDRSVASGRTMAAITKGKDPGPSPFLGREARFGAAARWSSRQPEKPSAVSATPAAVSARRAPTFDVSAPKLTHPDRILWPDVGLTKHDLAEYLLSVAPRMIEHCYGRPCSFVRAPDGIGSETFFQRHAMRGQPKSIHSVVLDEAHEPYLEVDDAQAIVDVAQISVIELHLGNGAPFEPHVPGRLVLDLDPGPDVAFDAVIDAARELRERLGQLALEAFCKTTGGKGLHVVVPLLPDAAVSWDQAKLFTQTLAAQMAADSPGRYVTSMAKRVRNGRIFIDYLRNDTLATAVAPFSPRARPGAPVSMPLTWNQVRKGLDPQQFSLVAPARVLKGNAWEDYAKGARPLLPAIRRLLGDGR